MQAKPSLFAREDTFLGICEGLGEDTGIPPLLLRLALALSLFWSPAAAIAAYLALGVVVLASRLLFPERRIVADAPAAAPQADNDEAPLAQAA
jgi:phage shock protein C